MPSTVTLASRSYGSGPPLVVLHGLLGSGANWRSIARGLEDCREVHLLDARNHGASPHADEMDYPTMAGDVIDWLDRNGIDAADLIGHSMGGKIAMHVALSAPSRVRRLVVVDIAPAISTSDHRPLLDALAALAPETMTRRSEADAALAGDVPEPGLRAFLLQNLASSPDGLRWRIDLEAIGANMDALLAFPGVPGRRFDGVTLFVRGAQSDYVLPAHEPAITAAFPRARIETVDDAGHWVHAEQPARFIEIARAFLGCAPR